MNPTGFIISLLFFVFTGWFATWFTIRMLFHPVKPSKFPGSGIRGIFRKNQQPISEKFGRLVSLELLSFFDHIEEWVINPGNLQKLRPDIETHIDDFLRVKLKVVFPMLSMMMGEKTILQLKQAFLMELESLFPVLMKNYMDKIRHDPDPESILAEKAAGFSEKIGIICNQQLAKELKSLEITGAVLGLFIGLAQSLIIFLIKY